MTQVRHPLTGFWQEELVYEPKYRHKTTTKTGRFLFFTWKVEKERITNESVARTDARMDAVRWAVDQRRRRSSADIRVLIKVEREHRGSPMCYVYRPTCWCIWENGVWQKE